MDYSNELKELYTHTSFLEPRDYQIDIMNRVVHNIMSDKKMQVVMLPNAGGKTVMCNFLAVILQRLGYKVVIVQGEGGRRENLEDSFSRLRRDLYDDEMIRAHKDILSVSIFELDMLKADDVDVFLTDAVYGYLSVEIDVSKAEQYVNDEIDVSQMSMGERAIKGIYRIQRLVDEKNDISVVSFEGIGRMDGNIPSKGFTPIIATKNVTFLGGPGFDYEETVNEYLINYNQVLQAKMDNCIAAKTNKISIHEARWHNNFLTKTLESLETSIDTIVSFGGRIKKKMNGAKEQETDARLARIEEKLGNVAETLGNVAENVDVIKNTVDDINKYIEDRRKFMDMYFEIYCSEDDESIVDDEKKEKMIAKFTSALSNHISQHFQKIQCSRDFGYMCQIVKVSLGEECWKKLSPESITKLATAKYLLNRIMELEDSIKDPSVCTSESLEFGVEAQYASVCIEACSAFEIEMSKRFIDAYKEYLKNERHLGIDYEKTWPGALLKKKKDGQIVLKDCNDFVLGECDGIMGLRTEKETYRQKNNELFLDFCKDKLLLISDKQTVDKKIRQYSKMINNVRIKFRNPAAHKSQIDLMTARECIDYIMEVEKVLGVMLAEFKL